MGKDINVDKINCMECGDLSYAEVYWENEGFVCEPCMQGILLDEAYNNRTIFSLEDMDEDEILRLLEEHKDR